MTEESGNNHRLKSLPIDCPWSASSTTKTDRHNIAEILLKVALNTTLTLALRCISLLHFTIGLGFGNCNYIVSLDRNKLYVY